MIYSILFLIFIIILTYYNQKGSNFNLVSPVYLFSIMQIVVLVIQILAYFVWNLEPMYLLNLSSFIILIYSYLAFYIGSNIQIKFQISKRGNNIGSLPFYITAIIGFIGTIICIRNMNLKRDIIVSLVTNFNYFDLMFKTSSYGSILWLSNIAALFWFNYAKKTKFNTIISFICFFNILFRAAYLYLIIAVFYYLTPRLINQNFKSLNARLKIALIAIGMLILLTPFLLYKDINLINGKYIIKIYPYTAGCFSNLAYYSNKLTQSGPENANSINSIFRDLGFSQIMQYIDKYFNTNLYQPLNSNGFLFQIKGIDEEGNMSSIYLTVVKNPIFLGLIYLIFIGYLSKVLMENSKNSIFAMSCFCFFSAANFLSFSGGGHFLTTRFFPALIYIWPILILNNILKIAVRRHGRL